MRGTCNTGSAGCSVWHAGSTGVETSHEDQTADRKGNTRYRCSHLARVERSVLGQHGELRTYTSPRSGLQRSPRTCSSHGERTRPAERRRRKHEVVEQVEDRCACVSQGAGGVKPFSIACSNGSPGRSVTGVEELQQRPRGLTLGA